jgi:hypothetical protein
VGEQEESICEEWSGAHEPWSLPAGRLLCNQSATPRPARRRRFASTPQAPVKCRAHAVNT